MLVGLFDWAVRSRRTVPDVAGPFPSVSQFRSEVPDAILDSVVRPAFGSADRAFARVRGLQRGPVQVYLLYVFATVVLLLMVTR